MLSENFDEEEEEEEEEEEDEDIHDNRRTISNIFSVILDVILGFLQAGACLKAVEMLNVPAQCFPASGSQQRVTPAGHARNKVELKPGHSLLDWIRLSKSGRDLTGLRGRVMEVTHDELKKHNTPGDCWTCIRGLVYNVSAYMDFHPGGEAELMRAAGRDGTALFDQVHRWVNHESMLKACLVGRMALAPAAPPQAQTEKTDAAAVNDSRPPPVPERRPRFDWFQTEATVNIVIYTRRRIPRSGCAVVDLQDAALRVETLLGRMSYLLCWRLSGAVEQRVEVQEVRAVGKVTVCLRKCEALKWTRVGEPMELHDSFLPSPECGVFYRGCELVWRSWVTHDTQLQRWTLPVGSRLQVPVGRHVYLKARVGGAEVVKPYTPVENSLLPQSAGDGGDVHLMIKIYPDGVFTSHLASLPIGACLSLGGPEGSFTLRLLRDVTHLYLLAAGTGFTPMTRLLHAALQDVASIRKVKLMFFNRGEKDILWFSQLEELGAREQRFEVEHVLSEAEPSWTGRRGRMEVQVLREFLQRPESSRCLVCVCGPTGFTQLALQSARELEFSQQELYAFQG